jgi:hypothetical protein
MAQFEIQIAPFYGFLLGVAYSNENLSGIETEEDDVQHFLQLAIFIIMINFVWYTKKKTDIS